MAARDLLDDGHLTETGCALHNQIPARITDTTGRPGLPKDDVATATRVLNQVRARARALLADL